MKERFDFKQFSVQQSKSIMRVNTDGVLLGAWCQCTDSETEILDVGAGTGVIALMMAQRFEKAKITAVEIDKQSADEAGKNFEHSPWKDRLKIINEDFTKIDNLNKQFDCIITNPPFYTTTLLPKSELAKAKHTVSLTYEKLIEKSARLLKENGTFCTIIPFENMEKFMHLCNINGLFCAQKTLVYSTNKKAIPKRVLLNLQKKINFCAENKLYIIYEGTYSEEYKKLTSDFYLNF